jgi:hypothetical protein
MGSGPLLTTGVAPAAAPDAGFRLGNCLAAPATPPLDLLLPADMLAAGAPTGESSGTGSAPIRCQMEGDTTMRLAMDPKNTQSPLLLEMAATCRELKHITSCLCPATGDGPGARLAHAWLLHAEHQGWMNMQLLVQGASGPAIVPAGNLPPCTNNVHIYNHPYSHPGDVGTAAQVRRP